MATRTIAYKLVTPLPRLALYLQYFVEPVSKDSKLSYLDLVVSKGLALVENLNFIPWRC